MPRLDSETVDPLLAALAALGEPGVTDLASAAPGSLADWLATVPTAVLPAIADVLRRRIRWGWQYGEPTAARTSERRLLQRQTAALAELPANSLLTALASLHGSGYVREAALRRLLDGCDGSEVPFLLLRCNDWVPAIAQLAQAGLRARLRPEYARHLLRSYRLIELLQHAQRNVLSDLLREVRGTLQQPAAWPVLFEARDHADKQVRRAAYLLHADAVLTEDAAGAESALRELLRSALQSRDLWLRIWAARTARARLYGRALVEVLSPAQRDRSAPVRREALLAFLDDFPELRRSLLDPCAGLRAMVRFYLRKKAHLDFAALYRHELRTAWQTDCAESSPATVRRICIALDGLGETTSTAAPLKPTAPPPDGVASMDSPALSPEAFLYDARPRVRRSALRALVRGDHSADKAPSLSALQAALGDSSAGVVRCALELLASEAGGAALLRLGADTLWQAFCSRSEPGTRRRILSALGQFGRWTRLGYLLRACDESDPQLAAMARRAVASALSGQIYTRPTSSERARVEQALAELTAQANDPECRVLARGVRSALAAIT